MAIDPNVIAALVGGSSAGAKTSTAVGSSTGIDWGKAKANQPGAWNLGQSIIDILSTGGYASAGVTRKVGENVAAIQRGDLGGLLDLLNPLSVIPAAGRGVAERRTYSENLRDLGVDKNVSTWLGLALDIGLDPTTYITGGTIAAAKGIPAGLRLASTANKANAVVARRGTVVNSAAEAAAENIPTAAKPFTISDVPLTQGQKLGNFLTGVLRGAEYSRSNRAAELGNRKLAKMVAKDDAVFADEFLNSVEGARKNVSGAIADDVAVLNRDLFMKAVAENPGLQAKFAKRLGKVQAQSTKAAEARFVDPKTAAKVSAPEAIDATKAAQAEKIMDVETPVNPEVVTTIPEVENAVVRSTTEIAERLAEANKAEKSARRSRDAAARAQSSYGKIAAEMKDYAAKVNDPATGKRLINSADTDAELFEYIAKGLSEGKLNLTADRTAKFARALGVSSDPQQTKIDLINKTLLMSKAYSKLASKEEILEQASQLARALSDNFAKGTSENVVAVTGATDAAEAGKVLDDALDLENTVSDEVTDLVNNKLFDNPTKTAKTAEELTDAATDLRTLSAQQIIESVDFLNTSRFTSLKGNLIVLLQNSLSGMYEALKKLAKETGETPDDLLQKMLDGDKAIINNPAFTLSKNAIRLDMLNTEARFESYKTVFGAVKANVGKNNRTLGESVQEEAHLLRLGENLLRLFGIPVRTAENILMQLKRDGRSKVGEALSKNFKPAEINITMSDILMSAIKSGDAEVFGALRFPGARVQNVMPSNFEYAFLTINRYKNLGEEIVPGTNAWDEVKKALNQNYKALGDVKQGERSVDEYFKPAPHLEPDFVTVGKGDKAKKVKLKKITDLDAKLDAAIAVMVKNADELASIHAVRAAARTADTVAEVMPDVRAIFFDMFSFLGVRERFMANMVRLGGIVPANGRDPLMVGIAAENVPGLNKLTSLMKNLIVSSGKSAKAFKDPEIAKEVGEMIMNMFMKSITGGTRRGPLTIVKGDTPEIALAKSTARSYIVREISKVTKAAQEQLDLVDAMGVTRPSTKVTPKQATDGKNARRKANEVNGEEAIQLTGPAVKGQDEAMQAASDAAKDGPADQSTIPSNVAEGNVDPQSASAANQAKVAIDSLTDLKLNERFMVAFSGRVGMGLGLKVVIGGIEYFNLSKTGWFNNGLRSMYLKYNKNNEELNSAFKLVQQWGKAMAQRVDQDIAEIPFREWAETANTTGVNMDAADDFAAAIDGIFGVDGVVAGSINQPYFADELNNMFGMRGFWEIGEEQAFKLPDDLGPEGIKYSWARADIDTMASTSKKKNFNALSFMSNYVSALHAVQTRIGVGQSFSSFFGRTAKQIKDENLDPNLFKKVDENDEFAKYIDTDKLYDARELEQLAYVKKYITYERSFSGAMKGIVETSDLITTVLKASHTTWRVGHHVTSIVGEAIMNTLAGVGTKNYHNALQILKQFDPSMYKSDPDLFMQYKKASSPKGMQLNEGEFNSIAYVNAATGKRTLVSTEAVYYAAERLGILTRGGASTVEDLDLKGMADFSSGVVGATSRINGKLANFSSHRDNFFRMAHFIKELEKGGVYKSFEEAAIAAAKEVTTYHPTIGGLSAFERKYMRRAVFFYTWQRIAATKVFQLMIEKPGAVIVPSKIQYAFAEANGFNPESFGDPWDPNGVYASWNTGSTFGPQFQGPGGKGDAWGFGPAIPQLDILNSLFGGYTVQPGQSGLDVLTRGSQSLAGQNLSPLPKWFAELTTGNRVGVGGDIRNPIEYAIDQVGGINTLSKVTGIGREVDPDAIPSEEAEKKTRLLINWFLGQKLQDYSTDQSLRQWDRDQTAMLQRLTGQE
jgi:hypothetical protein